MKTSDMRAKARAIFGSAVAEPMPKQPNGAKALQQRANARPIPTYKVGGVVKKPMPAASAASGNRMAREEADEMRFMEAMEPKQNRQSMPMRSGKPPVYGVGKPAFPNSAASAASADRIAKQEADEKKLMDAMRGRDEGPRKPVTLKEKPVQVDLDEKRKKVRLNEKRVPVTLDEKRVRVDKMEYKTGGKAGKYANGGAPAAQPMGQVTAAYGANLRDQVKAGTMTNAQAQAAQNAFVKEQMAARTAADAKASMAKPMGQVTADFGAGLRNQINTGKMTTAQAQATQNNFVRDQMAMRTAADAKATAAKPMGQVTAAYGADLRDQIKAGKMTVAQAQAAQNAFIKQQMAARAQPIKRAKGGKVQTSSDTARKLATEMGGMKKGGKAKQVDIDMKMLEEASRPRASLPNLESKVAEARNLNTVRAKETSDAAKKQSFKEAFAEARRDQGANGVFTWRGNTYNTKMAGETSKAAPTRAKPASPYSASTPMKDIARNTSTSNSRPPAPSKSTDPYSSNTPTKNIARNTKIDNSQMSDAQLRNFIKGLNADSDRSLDDTEIRKFVSDNDRAADRSLAAMKAKKDAEEKRRLSSMVSGISKATTASLSDAARRAVPQTPGYKKGGKVKEPKPKNGLAVMIAIGKPMKPAKKMNGGPMAERSTDMESSKVTREMAMGGAPMGYAAGGAGKTRKGQAPIKKAQGGAAKVRKGMMTPEGDIINVMNKMRGK
jgi:hypothetical protein